MQPVLDRYQGLHAVDYGAIAVYFLAVLFVGYYCSRRQTSTDDYFFAGRRMPWFAVGLSIVATVLSTVTYLSTPGEMIKNGVGANAQLFSYPLIFLLVSYFIIPFLMRQRVTTAYEYLEERFDLRTRIFGASIFILLRTAWMGMVIFTASLALAKICNLPFFAVVLGLAIVGTLYTVLGGLKAVIWTDVLQFFVLLAGALFTLVYVSIDSGNGVHSPGGATSCRRRHPPNRSSASTQRSVCPWWVWAVGPSSGGLQPPVGTRAPCKDSSAPNLCRQPADPSPAISWPAP